MPKNPKELTELKGSLELEGRGTKNIAENTVYWYIVLFDISKLSRHNDCMYRNIKAKATWNYKGKSSLIF